MNFKPGITACSIVAAFFPAAIFAFNLQFLGEDPMKDFSQEDWQMAGAAFDAAIDHNADGEVETWDNPNSNNSGAITPIKTFSNNKGEKCRVMEILNRASKQQSKFRLSFCRGEDSMWHHSG